jgi:hypothetical protein
MPTFKIVAYFEVEEVADREEAFEKLNSTLTDMLIQNTAYDVEIEEQCDISEVVVEVRGGVAEVTKNSSGVKVTVIDHDGQ